MARPVLAVIEDSSKARFGGGQKVTLNVLSATESTFDRILFDCARESEFINRARALPVPFFSLRWGGRIVGGTAASFSIGASEVLRSCIALPRAVFEVVSTLWRRGLFPNRVIIYCATKKALIIAALLHLIAGYKFVFHAHSLDSRNSIWFWLLRAPIMMAERTVCVSNVVRRNIGTANCRVVYNPGPPAAGRIRRTLHPPYHIAVFATLLRWKGIVYFIDSHKYLRFGDVVQYHVFGDGPERKHLEKTCTDQVRLEGFVEDATEVMRDLVDILVVPSISTEACPMAPIEALSYGIPVIATNIGGQAEIVIDSVSGMHVPPRSARAIAAAIDELIANPGQYERMSRGAIERATAFNEVLFARNMVQVLSARWTR